MPRPSGHARTFDSDKQMIMHAELPILAGHLLMATDMVESMGHELVVGNNTTIHLEPDTLEEAQRLYDAISEGGSEKHLWRSCSGERIGAPASIASESAGCSASIPRVTTRPPRPRNSSALPDRGDPR
jgi:uncharacterized glyoxalase superfamily protein PhnB